MAGDTSVRVEGETFEMIIPLEAAEKLIDSTERMYFGLLDWASQNPHILIAILAFISFLVYTRSKAGVEKARLKAEYNLTRNRVREDAEVPLPLYEERRLPPPE